MINYRGQGKRLDSDIRELLTQEISAEKFSKIWGSSLYIIIKQLFIDRLSETLHIADEEKRLKEVRVISSNVSMFCVAFV